MAVCRPLTPCGHCGAADVGTFAAGYGFVRDEHGAWTLCHPNEPGRMDCYHLVTLYKHATPCHPCRSMFPVAGPPGRGKAKT